MKQIGKAVAIVMATAGAAQAQGFDPRAGCDTIVDASETEQTMIAAWTFGYLAGHADNVRAVDGRNNAALLGNIAKACQANPGASLMDIVTAANKSAESAPSSAHQPGSAEDARALLMQFYAPNANHHTLSQALLPTEAEVLAVYAEPLGSAYWADLSAQLGPNTAFGPKPDHNHVLLVHTTTRALVEGQPVLREFPGGYKDVLPHFKIDVPIMRFKFVTAGETLGLAFDGLIFLNGRWVLMPKPWRSLPD